MLTHVQAAHMMLGIMIVIQAVGQNYFPRYMYLGKDLNGRREAERLR
jgi:hypothetical protein